MKVSISLQAEAGKLDPISIESRRHCYTKVLKLREGLEARNKFFSKLKDSANHLLHDIVRIDAFDTQDQMEKSVQAFAKQMKEYL